MKFRYLNRDAIKAENLKYETGVYILANTKTSKGKYIVKYVGRSTDLDARLKRHVKNYTYFGYELYSTEYEAYIRELALFDQYDPPDNIISPASP